MTKTEIKNDILTDAELDGVVGGLNPQPLPPEPPPEGLRFFLQPRRACALLLLNLRTSHLMIPGTLASRRGSSGSMPRNDENRKPRRHART